VCGLIEHEELQGAILVGHSYAGMVITGVAQQVNTERLSHLIYLDAVVPEPGEAWSSGHSVDTQTARRAMIAQSGQLAPPNPEVFGLQGDDHAWLQRRQTPQPGGCYDSVLHFDRKQVQRWLRHFYRDFQ
jgi:pimeloyl-ACP methyl ester carboxylesterase